MRLVLIDSEPLFGVGLAHALSGSSIDHRLCVYAAVNELPQPPFPEFGAVDAVVVDSLLLDPGASLVLASVSAKLPGSPVVVVVRCLEEAEQWQSVAAGVIHRTLSPDAFLMRLRQIVATYGRREPRCGDRPQSRQSVTPRQHEVLSLIARGESNKRIAAALNISERTVKLHVTALFESLGARNRTQVLVRALQRGMVLPEAARRTGLEHA